LHGKVVKGNQLGRKLGFPTANLQINSALKLIPSSGSYAVKVEIKDISYDGMLNIGVRPTVNASTGNGEVTEQVIEVNIFDFDRDIYGEEITIKLIKLIRKEQKFDSLNDLKNQLIIDKQMALDILLSSTIKLS